MNLSFVNGNKFVKLFFIINIFQTDFYQDLCKYFAAYNLANNIFDLSIYLMPNKNCYCLVSSSTMKAHIKCIYKT